MHKYSNPTTEFAHGYLNEAGVRLFPSIDDLYQKKVVSRSIQFKRCKHESWPAEQLQFKKILWLNFPNRQ